MSEQEMDVEKGTENKDEKKEVKEDLSNPDVITKYRTAAEIVNQAITNVIKQCVVGSRIVDICSNSDKFIVDAVSKLYNNKKNIEKGIGFPTCISVNNIVGHFSPLSADQIVLKEGDLVKVDLGAHIDGYVSVAAHSFVLSPNTVTGKQADVILACHTASEIALRLLKPGNKNTQITDAIAKVAADYKVNPVVGVLSHQQKRFVIDGEKVIINKTEVDQKVDEIEFAPNEVYAIDIVMSTGDGKPREIDERTTVYKRSMDTVYKLKTKTARLILSEIDKQFPTFPFTIRALDEKKVRFGIKECRDHDLVHAYPVLSEKEGEFVAHFKFTALVLGSGTTRITGVPQLSNKTESTNTLSNNDLKALLTQSVAKKKTNKKKKKPTKAKKDGDKKDEKAPKQKEKMDVV